MQFNEHISGSRIRLTGLLLLVLLSLRLTAQAPAGYYDAASGLSGEALKTALYDIIKGHTTVSESSIWNHFQNTDKKSNGAVWDMYSSYEFTFTTSQCGTYNNEGDCYNREHSWPSSWSGNASPMNTDLFHIYPTDGYVNGIRGNLLFSEVGSANYTSTNGSKRGSSVTAGFSGTVFEPINEYKGDFARTYFYMATRYENLIAGWTSNTTETQAMLAGNSYPAFKQWYIDLLISWHLADPVSQKEIDRNNAVYGIQGNRNPFIDQPEYVNYIWGTGLADEPQYHVTGFSANTITLNWTDATGPTLPDGYLVRMSATDFSNIAAPVDGTAISDDFWNKNVAYGRQSVTFGGLTPGQEYYFKIFSYKGSGASIDYKTDGSIPQTSIQAN
jgi:endonuclease I